MPKPSWQPGKFGVCAFVAEVILLTLFVKFIYYGGEAHAADPKNAQSVGLGGQDSRDNSINNFYTMFQDIHVMTICGFAFVMTLLKNFRQSALGLNLFLMSFAVQIALVLQNIWELRDNGNIRLDIQSFINAEFCATAVLISFGAVIGKVSPFQLLTITLLEVFLHSLNEYFGKSILQVSDVGGSMFVHSFGAYFGLAISYMIHNHDNTNHPSQISDRISNLFSMIGVLLLWASWPSFNSVLASGDDRHRAVINTYICLTSSCVSTFATSALLDSKNRFSVVHFRNGTLAGGVAIGASADMMTQPYGAFLIGLLSGILAVLSQKLISPFLMNKLNMYDTFEIHNSHGIPGILGGMVGILMTAVASEGSYGKSLYVQFPARAPSANSTELYESHSYMQNIKAGYGRSAEKQAAYHAAALILTLVLAILGGTSVGAIIRRPFFEPYNVENYFDDKRVWQSAHYSEENEQ